MKAWQIVLIAVVVVLATGVVGARWWWQKNGAALVAQGAVVMKEGREYGRQATATQCVDEAIRRHTATDQGVRATITQSVFFKGCIETGSDRAALCATYTDRGMMGTARWLGGLCMARAPQDQRCVNVIQPLAEACKASAS